MLLSALCLVGLKRASWFGLFFIDDVYWMALSLLALDFIVWAFPYYIDPSFLSPEPPGLINLWKWWGNDQSSYGVNTWDHRPLNIYWLLYKTSTFSFGQLYILCSMFHSPPLVLPDSHFLLHCVVWKGFWGHLHINNQQSSPSLTALIHSLMLREVNLTYPYQSVSFSDSHQNF